jgi:hypothetical protein
MCGTEEGFFDLLLTAVYAGINSGDRTRGGGDVLRRIFPTESGVFFFFGCVNNGSSIEVFDIGFVSPRVLELGVDADWLPWVGGSDTEEVDLVEEVVDEDVDLGVLGSSFVVNARGKGSGLSLSSGCDCISTSPPSLFPSLSHFLSNFLSTSLLPSVKDRTLFASRRE